MTANLLTAIEVEFHTRVNCASLRLQAGVNGEAAYVGSRATVCGVPPPLLFLFFFIFSSSIFRPICVNIFIGYCDFVKNTWLKASQIG